MSKRKKITNGEEMMDALVEDIFRYEELAELEAEAIRHNVTGVANSVRYEELEVEVEVKQPPMPQTNMTAQLLRDDDQDDDNKENDEENVGRFKIFTDEETDQFLDINKNKNTGSKTNSDVKIVRDFFVSVGEMRDPTEILPKELDSLLARFFLGVRKRDLTEYEPDSLHGIHNSLDRYFRDMKLTISIKKDPEFAHSRRVLETKKKSLKSMGKGNKPNKADSLTGDEVAILRGKGIIGTRISGEKVGDYRPVQPKVFEEPKAGEKCPIHINKEYSRHRPTVDHDSRFSLRPLVDPKTNVWFSKQCVGRDKLGRIMKNMAEKGKLQGRKVNHSGRKTFATALLQSGKPVTEVAQLGGWKNIGSLNHYSVPSVKQQEEASHTISSVMIPESPENMYHDSSDIADGQIGEIVHQPCSIVPIVESGSSVAQMTNLSSNQMQSHSESEKQDNPLSLFFGAVISGGTININIVSSSNKKRKTCTSTVSSEIVSSQE
ncbi:Hypothetical predicted protein [Mytilus galloprovincialis]|uniref:Tyr recombinase domain-containing protein n=1 Tax=Mytilus galloprovincialis TaxID=29158 RepID=A0A8B6FAC9_MYTGA|nr:Hypothetical predicted protein [Mytilus galloprovincialis]